MVKTFVKIAKTFIGLPAMIVAIKKKSILILHLEAKYATKKRGQKNEIYAKNWVKGTWTIKSQRSNMP